MTSYAFGISNDRPIRAKVRAEARSWINTRYLLRGSKNREKGPNGAVDCGTFLLYTYFNCGFQVELEHEITSHDWWANRSDESYIRMVMKYCKKFVDGQCFRCLNGQMGDLIVTRAATSHIFNHGAIITDWPRAVHAVYPKVEEIDVTRDPMWATEYVEIWSPFGTRYEATDVRR